MAGESNLQILSRALLQVLALDLDRADGDPGLLSTAERARIDRLKPPERRRRALQAHGAVRRILADALDVDPGSLEFDVAAAGKPFLARPRQALQFNLSYSGRHGLVAVARDRSVGVDIEQHRPLGDLAEVAATVATVGEIEQLRRLPADRMLSSFFDLWTRKEALLKAVGQGFLIDPRQMETGIGRDRRCLTFEQRIWTIESLPVGVRASAAVAIEGQFTAALVVRPFG